MEKLIFDRNKYGKEFLIDTAYASEFEVAQLTVLPNFYTFAYLKKATGVMQINAQNIALQDDMMIFVPIAQIVNIGNANFIEGVFIFFEGEFLDKFFNEANFIFKYPFFNNADNPLYLTLDETNNAYFYHLFEEIHTEIRLMQPDSEHLIRALLYQLLIKTNRLYTEAYQHFDAKVLLNEHLLRFKYELEKNIKNIADVQAYAHILGISRVYLNKLCTTYFNKTAIQIIRERLALEIKKELLYTSKTISEIAYAYNFSDPPNFVRFFKQMTTQTPQQFRELSK